MVEVDAFRQYNGWTSGVCWMGRLAQAVSTPPCPLSLSLSCTGWRVCALCASRRLGSQWGPRLAQAIATGVQVRVLECESLGPRDQLRGRSMRLCQETLAQRWCSTCCEGCCIITESVMLLCGAVHGRLGQLGARLHLAGQWPRAHQCHRWGVQVLAQLVEFLSDLQRDHHQRWLLFRHAGMCLHGCLSQQLSFTPFPAECRWRRLCRRPSGTCRKTRPAPPLVTPHPHPTPTPPPRRGLVPCA